MSDTDRLHGLSCPRCGGMVPIPEGQVIVNCPFCEQRSLVRGERGLVRYQVPRRVPREQAVSALQRFLSSHGAIARDAIKRSEVSEAMPVYLPFWVSWTRALGWVFGQKRERSGEHTTYKAREVRVVQDMNWTGAACDVGEFGVNSIPSASSRWKRLMLASCMIMDWYLSQSVQPAMPVQPQKLISTSGWYEQPAWIALPRCLRASCASVRDWYITRCGCCASFTGSAPSK